MKTNLKKELHAKSGADLGKQLKEGKVALAALKLDAEMSKLKNTSLLSVKRKEIAVIKTIINEKLVESRIAEEAKAEDKKEASTKVKPAKVKAGKGGKNE